MLSFVAYFETLLQLSLHLFKCLYLNIRYHYRRKPFSRNFKVAIPISKTTGHRFITLVLPHSLFSMDLPVGMDIKSQSL